MTMPLEVFIDRLKTELLHKLAQEVTKKQTNIEILDGLTPFTSRLIAELYVFTKEELKDFINSIKTNGKSNGN